MKYHRNHDAGMCGSHPVVNAPMARNVRIVFITENLGAPYDEGAKKSCFQLVNSLKRAGAKVSICSRNANPLLMNVFQLPSNRFLIGRSFGREMRAWQPDLILYVPASSGTAGAFMRAAIIRTQAPGIPLAMLSLQYRRLSGWARYVDLKRCANIVYTQSEASREVFSSFGCKAIRLPAGVDSVVFRPVSNTKKRLLRSKYGFYDGDRIVLHVGHCNRDRNVAALTALVVTGVKPILITSTSTGVDWDLVRELQLAGIIVITDFVKNIQHFYQLADCYLFPVLRATSAIDAPLSVLEAMACNLPVVTTRFGTLPEIFQAGNGFYFGESDEDIVRSVAQAVERQDCRTAEMAHPYSWDAVASGILQSFQKAVVP